MTCATPGGDERHPGRAHERQRQRDDDEDGAGDDDRPRPPDGEVAQQRQRQQRGQGARAVERAEGADLALLGVADARELRRLQPGPVPVGQVQRALVEGVGGDGGQAEEQDLAQRAALDRPRLREAQHRAGDARDVGDEGVDRRRRAVEDPDRQAERHARGRHEQDLPDAVGEPEAQELEADHRHGGHERRHGERVLVDVARHEPEQATQQRRQEPEREEPGDAPGAVVLVEREDGDDERHRAGGLHGDRQDVADDQRRGAADDEHPAQVGAARARPAARPARAERQLSHRGAPRSRTRS